MLKFYTDGASTMKKINNEWIRCNGGAAMVCINDENKIIAEYKRGFKNTTNNYCELHAIYLALSYWNNNYPNEEIEIYSDSAYTINGITQWINGWRANGWVNSKKEEVKNRELWEFLDNRLKKFKKYFNIEFVKVKGHAGNHWNEICDKLANAAMDGV